MGTPTSPRVAVMDLAWLAAMDSTRAMMQKANTMARGLRCRPLEMYMKGPALYPSVSVFFSLYFTERSTSLYLMAMARKPHTHIQNRAPGPPMAMAEATPTMFPVPTVVPMAAAWTEGA